MSIELSDSEWQQVLGILSMAPWRDANPLLMKIGEQLRTAQQASRAMDGMERAGVNAGAGSLKQ